jgi:hypothetical protein
VHKKLRVVLLKYLQSLQQSSPLKAVKETQRRLLIKISNKFSTRKGMLRRPKKSISLALLEQFQTNLASSKLNPKT